mmetsp:Transcript_11087/g.23676  ORF Transcript_11087/g.23676 Transcript_11087/m.23676 type:complete len:135 (-) Transcript_11087:454-858(-)
MEVHPATPGIHERADTCNNWPGFPWVLVDLHGEVESGELISAVSDGYALLVGRERRRVQRWKTGISGSQRRAVRGHHVIKLGRHLSQKAVIVCLLFGRIGTRDKTMMFSECNICPVELRRMLQIITFVNEMGIE